MKVFIPKQINDMAFALKNGKAIILPTDTVWGIISLQKNNIYEIKKRSLSKKIVIFVNSVDKIPLPKGWDSILNKYWPGALTVIYNKIGYRIPNSPLLLKLLNLVQPIYCSSANISGQNPIKSIKEASEVFKDKLDKIDFVDINEGKPSDIPSTIIDLDKMVVLRQGSIDGDKIIKEIKELK